MKRQKLVENKRWFASDERRVAAPSTSQGIDEVVNHRDEEAKEIWSKTLRKSVVPTNETSGYLIDYSWDQLEQQDYEISISTCELCKMYLPIFAGILDKQVDGSMTIHH